MSSELMKKISGQLTDTSNNALGQFPFGITIEFTRELDSDNPGGWIGSAPIKTSGQFDLFTTYDLPVVESVGYKIFKDAQLITEGNVIITNFETEVAIDDATYQELLRPFDSNDDSDENKLVGTVVNLNGFPVSGTITIYKVALSGNTFLGSTMTNDEGYYEFSFTTADSKALKVEFTRTGIDPVNSDTIYNANGLVNVDLIIPVKGSSVISSEFELLFSAVSDYTEDMSQEQLADDNVSKFLAGTTGENEMLVKTLLSAMLFSIQTSVLIEAFYGLMRTTMQSSLEVLINMPTEDLTNALKLAVSLNIIPHYDDSTIQGYVVEIKNSAKQLILSTDSLPANESKGVRILSTAISGAKLSGFLDYYYANDISAPEFWDTLNIQSAVSGITIEEIDKLKAATIYAVLTGNNPAMVNTLVAESLEDIVLKSNIEWSNLITDIKDDTDFVFPDNISGYDTDEEKITNYAENLKNNFTGSYRSLAVKQAVISDTEDNFPELKENLDSFVADNPSFDILRTPSYKIAEIFPSEYVTETFVAEVATIQRLNVIAPSHEAVLAIKQLGANSATDVIQMPKDVYVNAMVTANVMNAATAAVSYTNAINTVVVSQTVALAAYAMVDLSIPSIYPPNPVAEADLRGLFGTLDFCTCSECSSIFSPAAYLVDSLELLRQSNLQSYNQLHARRPDLWDVKLTCKNTNTTLPYIDLANEVLEDMVRVSQTNANPSSNPYNYFIKGYNTGADDNGTDIPGINEKTLDAVPEHIDEITPSAYQKLRTAKYPWTAPYNYFHEQVKEHLNLIDINPYKLPQAFVSKSRWIDSLDIKTACAYLNISGNTETGNFSEEYAIITDTFSTNNLYAYYGLVSSGTIVNPANRSQLINVPNSGTAGALVGNTTIVGVSGNIPFMKRVDILMQQTELTIIDILELLDCYYINPIIAGNRALRIDGDPQTTCDTSKLTVTGLTENHLKSIHRFIRLQRKTGWNKYELDQAFTTLGVNANSTITHEIIIAVAQIKRLTDILKCNLLDVLPFWGDFGHLPYSKYTDADIPQQLLLTQYEQMFRDPAVIDQITDYPFPVNEEMIEWRDETLLPMPATGVDSIKYMLGALQISEKDFDTLFAFYNADNNLNTIFQTISGNFKFSYSNVLRLYKEFTLCRLLKLSVKNWCIFRSWIANLDNNNPFISVNISSPVLLDEVFAFLDKVNILKGSVLSSEVLHYVFEDTFISDAGKEATRKTLFNQAQNLRAALSKLTINILDEGGNVDSKTLQSKLEKIVDAEDADFLVNVIGNITEFDLESAPYNFSSADETRFEGLLPSDLSPGLSTIVTALISGSFSTQPTSAIINQRLLDINSIYNDVYIDTVLKPQIRSSLSVANKIDLDITTSLLSAINESYPILLQQDFIDSTGDINPSVTVQANALKVIEKISKAASIVLAYKLSLEEAAILLNYKEELSIPDIVNLPVGMAWAGTSSGTSDYQHCTNLIDWMDVRKKINPSPTGIFQLLKSVLELDGSATNNEKKETWVNAFALAVQIGISDLEVLVGNYNNASNLGILTDFNFTGTSDPAYLIPANYKKILDCFDMQSELEVNMQTCNDMAEAVCVSETQTEADVVVQAIKSRFGSTDWLDQIKPASDRLRIGRRDAMVAYLLAYPPNKYRNEWITANDIFETLLIDTQMMPIVKTSRIKQAISTVQLFVDRCLLNEEKILNGTDYIMLTAETQTQWNLWRKWYRIWEANRRIFVYPENWIEPELRDDKSPFFKDVEKFIKQNEVNADTMAEAYRNYLENLEEVSHMDIVGYYAEKVTNDYVVHVWGRTKSDPHIYYYRKRVQNIWTAWEKMDTQVDGDNFVAVKWRGRLRLYWLNVVQKTAQRRQPRLNPGKEAAATPERYLEIKLCWTELNNGKWQAKKVGKEWIDTLTKSGELPWAPTEISGLLYNSVVLSQWMVDNSRLYTPQTLDDSLNNYISSLIPYCKTNADGDLEIAVLGRRRYVKLKSFSDQKMMDYRNQFPGYLSAANNDSVLAWDRFTDDGRLNDTENRFNQFYFNGGYEYEQLSAGVFTVKQNKVLAKSSRSNIASTYSNFMAGNTYFASESQYRYNKPKAEGYTHTDSYKLLKQAPAFPNAPVADKMVVLSGMGTSVSFPRFFYNDYNSSFFVERTSGGFDYLTLSLSSSGGSTPLGRGTEVEVSNANFQNDYSTALLGNVSYQSRNGVASRYTSSPVDSISENVTSVAAVQPKYRFYAFNYYKVEDLMRQLDINGAEGLFEWDFIQSMQQDLLDFPTAYQPTANVVQYSPATPANVETYAYPTSKLDFRRDAPTAIYNWELFFHIPLLIANKLMQDQQFDEALKWFHYIFNPTNQSGTPHGNGRERFWQFLPFYKESIAGIRSIEQIMEGTDLANAVNQWAADPFKPHLVARTRTSAYMRTVVMKYLDNLINWGDQLFRRDTMESINEATLLYILAAQILGKPPVSVPRRFASTPMSYAQLILNPMNAFSNAAVQVQTIMAPTGMNANVTLPAGSGGGAPMRYFAIPPNSKLLSYWDLVADRLFKIRNSQNIDGVERQLALFEPPIDPALLVRAAAAGVSLSDAVNELFAPLPQYRFTVLQQKASEMVQEVKGLGGSLLSAIEKKDAEQIALLRSSQEMNVMDKMREIKQMQLQEAQTQISVLQDQFDSTTIRRDYYTGLVENGLNEQEQSQLDSIKLSIPLKVAEGVARTSASVAYIIPEIKLGGPFTLGTTLGGSNLGNVANAAASAIGIASIVNDIKGSMAGIKGGYERRKADWDLQLKLANMELKQIEKQLVAAEIRASIAGKETEIQELQFNNAIDMDAAMHDKYSNEELYDWMIGEVSLTYFNCYKLAFDLAKRAERCYNFELGINTSFIQFGYWNSLKKGLLAGEGLSYDLKRMDASYLDVNKRQHELTKNISLAMLDPDQLLKLRSGEKAYIDIPEWLFDMDYPGHYFRRIKAVSISIPCVAGPYSTVSAKLTLNSSRYRDIAIVSGDYGSESNYSIIAGGGQSIATSTAQNDSGMFEMNFRDERYLPFEGAGVISNWVLELPSQYASFDRSSISDVIIHIHYTAKYDGKLATTANDALDEFVSDTTTDVPLVRYFSLKHEFSNEWYKAFENGTANDKAFNLTLLRSQFPEYAKGKEINVSGISFKAIGKSSNYELTPDTDSFSILENDLSNDLTINLTDSDPIHECDLEDIYFLLHYSLTNP
ncbi:hypothetical protein F0919_14450 [Taibaiella lutea]|uniref:Virulence plasmid A protein n=1 Tax=Taibaiella lutea TaxID=2608001 RepID=A0A5M6CKS0_9BACT|nr:neuraminidase-like domain-containing protein [Taibaiella lutea]KAA5533729.1 hypothetical protein F0919_14450 [Taibaiella lutea]